MKSNEHPVSAGHEDRGDREFLVVFWPWGAAYFASITCFYAAEVALSGDFVRIGSAFYFVLLLPLTWFGVAGYLKSLQRRSFPTWAAIALSLGFLAIVSCKFLFALAPEESRILLSVVNIVFLVPAWHRFTASTKFKNLELPPQFPAHLAWIEDVLLVAALIGVIAII